jgi:ribonuclease HI
MDEKLAGASPVDRGVRPSTLAAFLEALNGKRGDLDAWLECNNEAEVRAHVLALVKAESERCAKLCDEVQAEQVAQGTASPYGDAFARRIRDA